MKLNHPPAHKLRVHELAAELGWTSRQLLIELLVDGLTRVAVTMREAGLQTLIRPGSTELELAEALEQVALEVEPVLDPMINQLARLTLRRSLATEAVNAAERATGQLPEARPITVAFADMVGFTRLGRPCRRETSLGSLVGLLP